MSTRIEVIEAVAAGSTTLSEGSRLLGTSPDELQRSVDLVGLAQNIARRELAVERRRVRRAIVGLSLGVLATFTVVATRPAWAGTCASMLPAGLVTMCPNEAALASELNTNFQILGNALVNKTGGVTGTGITTAGAISSGSLSTGVLTASGTINATGGIDFTNFNGQAINLFGGYGMGVQNSTTYFRTFGGFSWFNGGSHVGGIADDPGGGSRLMRLSSAGDLTVTTINGRRPAYVVTANCASASCTASCGSGVVKQGWSLHGANITTANIAPASGTCGRHLEWMGSCLGQASCTANSGCGSSSVWLECW